MTDTATAPGVPPRAPARRAGGSTPGWLAKIVLLGLADGLAITGLLTSIGNRAWGYVALLSVTLVVLNVVYLPRRFVPMKYLLPGLFFLAVFGVYPVLYNVVASTTNYGTGHVLSRDQAISIIQSQSVQATEGATRYDATAMKGDDGAFAGYALFDPASGELFLGTADELRQLDPDAATMTTLATTGRTFVEAVDGLTGVRAGDLRTLPGAPDPATFTMPGETEGAAITISGGQAFENVTTRAYVDGTIVDSATGVVYYEDTGFFVSEDGQRLSPGFKTSVGFDNYREVFTSKEFRGPFVRVLVWNFAFAALSVITTFALGLFLASALNEVRMRGRKVYRSLLIIPYALPGFMTALVWKGMFNYTFGVNRWLPFDVPWLTSTGGAMFSLILVNLWLGYPYMFLVNTGALQSIPSELKEAASIDGANGFMAFRKITLPLLLVSVSPLLIASFAFNFNNFTLVFLLTGGQPRAGGESAGKTDLLITWAYRVALDQSPQRQGLAAALVVVIFTIVAILAALGFKYTKTFEEVR